MAFIWFILAIVFLALWLSSKGSKERINKAYYDRGYEAGRASVETSKGKQAAALAEAPFEEEVFIQDDLQAVEEEAYALTPLQARPATASAQPDVVAPARTKAEQTNRNLNLLLYTASFLIIAAAAAFIATSTPASVRLTALWAVIIAFYGVGLFLHARVPYLRSAATAFVGTGLAIIPFAGIALSQLGGLSYGWSWCITSLIGLVTYAIATIRLSSNVVGYLTIAFSLSVAASTVAVVSGPFVLYFVVLIIISLLFHVAAHVKLKWLPEFFQRPIQQTGHLLTPLTLVGSLLAYDTMTVATYQVVFWVATAYYLAIWFTNRTYVYETATRVLATVSILLTAFNAADFNLAACLWIWAAMLAAQVIYSFVRIKLSDPTSRTVEISWYWTAIGLAVVSLPYWLLTDTAQIGIVVQIIGTAVASLLIAWRLRSVYSAVPALLASVVLPFAIGRWPGNILIDIQPLVYVYAALALAALGLFWVLQKHSKRLQVFLQAAFWLYFIFALFVSFAQDSYTAHALSALVLTVLVLKASLIYKQWRLEIFAAILSLVSVSMFTASTSVPAEWFPLIIVGATAGLYLIGVVVHQYFGQVERRNTLVAATLIVGIGLIFGVFAQADTVRVLTSVTALLFALAALTARLLVKSEQLQRMLRTAYVGYPIITLLVAISLEPGWYVFMFLIATFIYFAASYIEKVVSFMVFGNLALVGLITSAWLWLKLDTDWMVFGVAWIAGALFYADYLLYALRVKDEPRWTMQLVFTLIALGVPVFIYFWFSDQNGYAAATTLVAMTGVIAVHGAVVGKRAFIEAGIYIGTFALQRLVGLAAPDLSIVVYGHWWAAVLLAVAYWRRQDSGLVNRLVLGTAAITLSSGIAALTSGGGYQLLFLVEHVALLVIGALTRTSWALWWGLVATVLAVLYFLRSSLFLSFLFLGLTLLGIVIWRLIKAQRKN